MIFLAPGNKPDVAPPVRGSIRTTQQGWFSLDPPPTTKQHELIHQHSGIGVNRSSTAPLWRRLRDVKGRPPLRRWSKPWTSWCLVGRFARCVDPSTRRFLRSIEPCHGSCPWRRKDRSEPGPRCSWGCRRKMLKELTGQGQGSRTTN